MRSVVDPALAIAYIRCSTSEQSLGPEAQLRAIQDWAARNQVRVAAVFQDDVSGALPVDKRPGLGKALDAVRRSGAGILLVAKIDRLARDAALAQMLASELRRSGAAVVSADGVGNGNSAEAELIRGIFAQFAAFERSLIRSRTKAAMAVMKSRGELVGSVPYGCKLGADGVHLEPNIGEQAIIAEMQALRAQGLSYRKIRDCLNEMGVPARAPHGGDGSPGRWHLSSVFDILAKHAKAA